uniref:Helix-hairpin-helix DNA-binding, class 1 n=1 Tax=Chlorobium chlorochromatii (strain CaD3) TaxID=340177 RepID=Q3AQ47_CHLCH
MKWLNSLATKLSLTKAEITLITALLGFLLLGGVVKNFQDVEERTTLIKRAEAARLDGAEVDSLLRLASLKEGDLSAEPVAEQAEEGEVAPSTKKKSKSARSEKKEFHGTVAFNKASAAQLQKIPGVGTVMAERMIAFRLLKGGKVSDMKELLEVKGIGAKKLEQLQPYLTLD